MWRITPKEESGLEALRVSPASKLLRAGLLVAASAFGTRERAAEAAEAVAMTNRPDLSAKADGVLPEGANAPSIEKAPHLDRWQRAL